MRDVKKIRIMPDEECWSYDMSALFASVAVDKALEVIREKLEKDQTRMDRTPLAPDDIIQLFSLGLKCTYSFFQ